MKKIFLIVFFAIVTLLFNNTSSHANDLPSPNNSTNLTPSGTNDQKNTSTDLYINNRSMALQQNRWGPPGGSGRSPSV